jgi:hypothetical protein
MIVVSISEYSILITSSTYKDFSLNFMYPYTYNMPQQMLQPYPPIQSYPSMQPYAQPLQPYHPINTPAINTPPTNRPSESMSDTP